MAISTVRPRHPDGEDVTSDEVLGFGYLRLFAISELQKNQNTDQNGAQIHRRLPKRIDDFRRASSFGFVNGSW